MGRDGEPRRFGDEEAALVLRRAARLQGQEDAAPARGFTLEQLQEIGAEAGIHPRFVAGAAASLSTSAAPAGDAWGRVLRAPVRFHDARVVAGTLPATAWEALLAETRAALGAAGRATHLPGSLEWRSDPEAEPSIHLRVDSAGGVTRVAVEADLRGAALASLLLPAAGAAILGMVAAGAGLGWGEGAELWTTLTAAAGGTAAGWGVWQRVSARWRDRLDGLVARLSAVAGGAAHDPAAPSDTPQLPPDGPDPSAAP